MPPPFPSPFHRPYGAYSEIRVCIVCLARRKHRLAAPTDSSLYIVVFEEARDFSVTFQRDSYGLGSVVKASKERWVASSMDSGGGSMMAEVAVLSCRLYHIVLCRAS
jgi:hypothetical protein